MVFGHIVDTHPTTSPAMATTNNDVTRPTTTPTITPTTMKLLSSLLSLLLLMLAFLLFWGVGEGVTTKDADISVIVVVLLSTVVSPVCIPMHNYIKV